MTKAIPDGFHSVTPFFMSKDVDGLTRFLEQAFDAKVTHSLKQKDNKTMHAQVLIGNSMILIGDSMGKDAQPMNIYIYTKDADAMYKKAVAAGGESIQQPADQFYGDRNGGIKDKFGNTWWVATHIEDVSDNEMQKRASEFEKKCAA